VSKGAPGMATLPARSASPTAHRAEGQARRAADSPIVDRIARVGFAARGTTYLLLGWVALQLGLGHHPGAAASQKGAFEELAHQPDGPALLALVAVGLAAYAIFRFVDAAIGYGSEDGAKKIAKRVGAAGRGIAYAVLTYAAVSVITHHATSAGSGSGSQLMSHGWGRWLVGAIGIGLLIGGAALVWSGVSRRFEQHLKLAEMGDRTRRVVEILGVVGTAARGVVFALLGWFFVDAALTYDPAKARGLDQSFRELLQHPGGRAITVAIAVGLIVFGTYSWCEAKWRRTGKEGSLRSGRVTTGR